MKPDRCSSCNAAIYWAEMGGKPHPVNVAENPAGTYILRAIVEGGVIVGLYCRIVALDAPISPGEKRRTSHFSTCTHADQHRKARRWIPCGYPGCTPTYCDDCDGKGHQPRRRGGR